MSEWTDALAEAYASAPADEFVIRTVEFLHPVFEDGDGNPDSIRICLDTRGWNLQIESGAPLFGGETKTFEALALEATLPEQSDRGMGELRLSLDNVPRTIIGHLQSAARVRASAMLIYREWVGTRDAETGEITVSGPPDLVLDQLTVKVVTATRLRLEASATFVDLLNRSFPRRTFSRTDFPGLFGGA